MTYNVFGVMLNLTQPQEMAESSLNGCFWYIVNVNKSDTKLDLM